MISDCVAVEKITSSFTVTQLMVESFARLTGDYNSMHMKPEIARKSRFRRPVVHGMLSFSFISIIQSRFRDHQVSFQQLSARFNLPLFINETVEFTLEYTEEHENLYSITGKWFRKNSKELLLTAEGTFITTKNLFRSPNDFSKSETNMLLHPIDEHQHTSESLNEQQAEELSFELSPKIVQDYTQNILWASGHVKASAYSECLNLTASFLISTIVGMKLPGRYATFTRFDITFNKSIQAFHAYTLSAHLVKLSRSAGLLDAKFRISGEEMNFAEGTYGVALNPAPKKMPTSRDMHEFHSHLGLRNKVVLITGASRGIGETTSKLFAALGAKTIVTYFQGKSDAEQIVTEIREAGGEAISVPCDVTKKNLVHDAISTVMDQYGEINILINNAVKEFSPKDILDTSWEDYLDELEVTMKGMHNCCTSVIPIFKTLGYGKIINISTVVTDNPIAKQSRYITAKSAVEGYTKSMAVEVAKYGIRVNLVAPNMTETDLVSTIPSIFLDKIAKSRPLNRHVKPVEVAQSIAFLASSWSDAMTGQKIVLNLGEPPFA